MILLSIDPGLEKLGFAVFDKNKKYPNNFKFLSSGLIKTFKTLLKEERLVIIYQELSLIIKKYSPKKIIFENIFFFKNQKTIIPVTQAQGVILLLAAQSNIDVVYFSPLQIKQIVTGYGLADKKSIKKIIDLTVTLPKKPEDDDEYDAIACGLAYCFQNPKLLK